MSAPRKPAAFRIEPEPAPVKQESTVDGDAFPTRKPRSLKPEMAIVIPAEVDVFDVPENLTAEPPPDIATKR
jgi:putative membrane protein